MSEEQKRQLEQQLWKIADTLRGKMDADDFRDYILGFIFYKYLSEKMSNYANAILKPDKLSYDQVDKHKNKKHTSQPLKTKRLTNSAISYCLPNFSANWPGEEMPKAKANSFSMI